jgi:hypothetical protein
VPAAPWVVLIAVPRAAAVAVVPVLAAAAPAFAAELEFVAALLPHAATSTLTPTSAAAQPARTLIRLNFLIALPSG